MAHKRITIFSGHYGSGKTNLAVNYALLLRTTGEPKVAVLDIDIVNPYFRTTDSADVLEKAGIRLISPHYANTNVEVPALPPEMYSVFDDKSLCAVIDVGGDERGALALGRFASILKEEDADIFLVANKYRPLTYEADGAEEIRREIEAAARLRFTAIIANPNLGAETKRETISKARAYYEELSEKTGLPVAFTSVREDIADKLSPGDYVGRLLPIKLYGRPGWSV